MVCRSYTRLEQDTRCAECSRGEDHATVRIERNETVRTYLGVVCLYTSDCGSVTCYGRDESVVHEFEVRALKRSLEIRDYGSPAFSLLELLRKMNLPATKIKSKAYVISTVSVCMVFEAGIRVQGDITKTSRIQYLLHDTESLLQISFAVRRCIVVRWQTLHEHLSVGLMICPR